MDNQIQISVVMSVYNEPIKYVDKAIQSILDQTFSEFEFIIILDNPDYQEMLNLLQTKAKQDSRISIIQNKENIGLAASLNRGIERVRGNYIARMDADDISKPDRLKKELDYIQSGDFDMISCLADKIDENGKVWDYIEASPNSESFISEILPIQNIIIHPTVLMKKSAFEELGGYRLFSSCQDYDLWLRMLTEGYKIGILEENLFCFRRHKNSITSSMRYIQVLNENYIRKLYKERVLNKGKDNFSADSLEQYLSSHKAKEEKKRVFESKCFDEYQQGLQLIKEHNFVYGILLVLISMRAYTVTESIKTSLKARRIKNRFLNKV